MMKRIVILFLITTFSAVNSGGWNVAGMNYQEEELIERISGYIALAINGVADVNAVQREACIEREIAKVIERLNSEDAISQKLEESVREKVRGNMKKVLDMLFRDEAFLKGINASTEEERLLMQAQAVNGVIAVLDDTQIRPQVKQNIVKISTVEHPNLQVPQLPATQWLKNSTLVLGATSFAAAGVCLWVVNDRCNNQNKRTPLKKSSYLAQEIFTKWNLKDWTTYLKLAAAGTFAGAVYNHFK